MGLVACDQIGDQLVAWNNKATQKEKDELREAFGCGGQVFDKETILHLVAQLSPQQKQAICRALYGD